MNKTSKFNLLSKAIFIIIVVFLLFSATAQNVLAIETGLNKTATTAFGEKITERDITTIIGDVISVVLGFVGIIFLILMIYGGFLWMVGGKGGDKGQINKAKDIIFNALTGSIIVAGAYIITYFVFEQLAKK